MAKNAQQKAREAKKKLDKRRKEQAREKKQATQSVNNRLDVRIAKTSPTAWHGERTEDVAIFDVSAREQLAPELANQALLIRNALEEIAHGDAGVASDPLVNIPRQSPYSDWRLFHRGFASWKSGDTATAAETWGRLDPERRPKRMADALLLSHREDLTELKQQLLSGGIDSDEELLKRVDRVLIQNARNVRQSQIERVAVKAAYGILQLGETDDEATVLPVHIEWLRDFTAKFSKVDSELVQDLHQTTVVRASLGNYIDLFQDCVRYFRGPVYDPRNELLVANFEVPRSLEDAEKLVLRYIQKTLPNIKAITPALANAIASHLYLFLSSVAGSMSEVAGAANDMFSGLFNRRSRNKKPPILEHVSKYLDASLNACPTNVYAYDAIEKLYSGVLKVEGLKKADEEKAKRELAEYRAKRLENLPNSVETRLQLVDYLLEAEKTQEAEKHIQWLAGTPQENPLAAAMQWKWHLLEAMRLSRRKQSLSNASEQLEKALAKWPAWLDRDWYHYLVAAIAVRSGNAQAWDDMPTDKRSPSTIADACMRMSAAQRMSLPAAELKLVRENLDQKLLQLSSANYSDLLPAASFFWDLVRIQLSYPAYRSHGRKILDALKKLIDAENGAIDRSQAIEKFRGPLHMLVHANCYGRELDSKRWFNRLCNPTLLYAIALQNVVEYYYGFDDELVMAAREKLGELARSLQDPYYRFYYQDLVAKIAQKAEEENRRMMLLDGLFGSGMFEVDSSAFDDDDFDDEEDDDDF